MQEHPELMEHVYRPGKGPGGQYILSLLNDTNLRRVLTRMLDEKEFLSPYGIRALSREYAEHPYIFRANGHQLSINYLPAESNTGMFGGNSNWRGPIWIHTNDLIIRARSSTISTSRTALL
jgi:glycogen debranching enzyme